MRIHSLFFIGAFLCGAWLSAQDELPTRTTIAHRLEADLSEVGTSLTLFNREEISLIGGLFLQDVLQWSPGVSFTRTGGAGQNTKMYVRGTEPRHSLILVDGMELRNTNSPDGYDIVNLPVGDIERIEVLRGPQSPLYGADALGGVLNIVTRKGGGLAEGSAALSAGTHNTLAGSFSTSGHQDKVSYSLHGSVFESDGYSIVDGGAESDPYEKRFVSLALGYAMSDSVDLQFTARHIESETHYDNAATTDATGYFSDVADNVFRLGLVRQDVDGRPMDRIAISYKEFQQDSLDFGVSHFASDSRKAEWQRTWEIDRGFKAMAGVEYLEEAGRQETGWSSIHDTLRTTSGFIQMRKVVGEKLALDLGGRLDDSRDCGEEATWRAAASHRIGAATRIKASVGTGFFAPNVYYLANAQDAATLQPERGLGYDLGIEHGMLDGRANLSITYFHNDIDNLLGWSPAYRVININETTTQGIETSLSWSPVGGWRVLLDWTHLQTEDLATGRHLDFRPENQLGVRIFWQPDAQKIAAFVGARHRSVMYNVYTDSATWTTYNNAERNPSPGGTNWEAALRYQLTDQASVFLRCEDLFDQQLEDMRDYNANPYSVPGRTLRAGLQWRF